MRKPYYLVKARSWPSVVDFFAGFASVNPECEPMHRFVSRVASSRYAEALFPLTSMHTLIISQTPEFESNREVLRVDFDCERQRFRFEYRERPFASFAESNLERPRPAYEAWTKECDAAAGFGAFERFLALKKWFA